MLRNDRVWRMRLTYMRTSITLHIWRLVGRIYLSRYIWSSRWLIGETNEFKFRWCPMYCMYVKHQIPRTCLVMHSSCHALVAHLTILHPVLPLRGLSFDQMSVPYTLYSSSLSIDQIFVRDLTQVNSLDLDSEISYFPEILTKVNQTCLTYL